ncbi:MAG TPA: sulfatase-like hydrolase/transferase [Candidatus Bathyarchaeia archaeon]|nr:sulfatase-like hydrolase/transferase [Candidatus Bathyarchaeia archaeon]
MIFVMCDDLGYGDVGFNGNSVIRTPHLDRMRGAGVCFTRFHTGGPVCSPTRGTCMTGRHYMRYGIGHANEGALPRQEITIAEIARQAGYRTGHFGKWHLGTLSKTEKDSNRGGPQSPELYSPPWDHGFDVCFSTEAKVPTWDPAKTPAEDNNPWGAPGTPWRASYWNERGVRVRENLEGDDARVILDRVEPFVQPFKLAAVSGFEQLGDARGDGLESDVFSLGTGGMSECGGDMGLAGAGVAYEEDVLALTEVLAAHELGHQRAVDGRLSGKIEGVERLDAGESGGPDTAFGGALFAFEAFTLAQAGQEFSGILSLFGAGGGGHATVALTQARPISPTAAVAQTMVRVSPKSCQTRRLVIHSQQPTKDPFQSGFPCWLGITNLATIRPTSPKSAPTPSASVKGKA